MIVLSKADSQIVLYAKGHFSARRNVQDIRTLMAVRAGVETDLISDRDIVVVLTELMIQLGLKVGTSNFIESIVFGSRFSQRNNDPMINFINTAIDLIHGMRVLDDDGNKLVDLQPLDPRALD